MKQGSTIFLRVVIFLLGIGVFALCVFVLPRGIVSDNTGYYRPLLLGMYVPAIPFFIALYQAFRLLGYIDKKKAFSSASVRALKNIQYCAIAISALYALGMPYIYIVAEMDDAPGAILMGLFIVFASLVIATFAAVLQKIVQSGLDIQAENELIV